MLKYHEYAWSSFERKPSGLYVFGKGLDAFEIVKQLVIEMSAKRQIVMVFGLDENDKHRVIWEAANAGVEFLPKDIEKDTGKKERAQMYEARVALFHSPGILAKDFLTDMVDPMKIAGLIIMKCETVHKDHGLQLCISRYKSSNPAGFVKAFSERVGDMVELRTTVDLLWVDYVLLFPRFEANVKAAIVQYDVQVINISLVKAQEPREDGFCPVVSKNLTKTFQLLESLHTSFVNEHGRELRVDVKSSLMLHKKSLENRATTDAQMNVLASLLFLRRAFFILLHEDHSVFHEFLRIHHPSAYRRPLWSSYPEVSPLYAAVSALAEEAIPCPKLQWVLHLVMQLGTDKKILILAEGVGTVAMICQFLAGFVPRTGSTGIDVPMDEFEGDSELLVDPMVFGVIREPMILLQELHAQANVLEKFQPDCVIFWDVSLLMLRRLEVYNSRCGKGVVAYLLSYEEACETEALRNATRFETDSFVSRLKTLQTMVITPRSEFPAPTRRIIVDDREFRSSLPLALLQVGFHVVPAVITVGDYVLSDSIVVERKAYYDLVGSLKSGRLLQQLQRMKGYYKKCVLLIELSDCDRFNEVSARDKGPFVMAKLSVIMRHFPALRVVWARNNTEAAKVLMSLTTGTKEPDIAQAISMGSHDEDLSRDSSRPVRFLTSIPFLTAKHVDDITSHCKTLKELAAMKREDMMNMIDVHTALKLFNLFHNQLKPK